MNSKSHYSYITGLKGLACLGVMLGHFYGIVRYAEYGFESSPLSKLLTSPFQLIFNESFWLYLFFIASGFLLANSIINSAYELVMKCIKRFFRLAIPILFASCIILLIFVLFGIHNSSTNILFQNCWYQTYYSFAPTIPDVLFSPLAVLLKRDSSINPPYWPLKEMLIASVMIYCFLYCRNQLHNQEHKKIILYTSFLTLAYLSSTVIFACMLGMLIQLYQKQLVRLTNRFRWFYVVTAILLITIYYLYPGKLLCTLFWGNIIILPLSFKGMNHFLSSGINRWLGTVSFGIYSFHWPIFCSIGGLLMLRFIPQYDITNGVLLSSVMCIILTLIIAYLYTITVEKRASCLTNKVSNLFGHFICWVSKKIKPLKS